MAENIFVSEKEIMGKQNILVIVVHVLLWQEIISLIVIKLLCDFKDFFLKKNLWVVVKEKKKKVNKPW